MMEGFPTPPFSVTVTTSASDSSAFTINPPAPAPSETTCQEALKQKRRDNLAKARATRSANAAERKLHPPAPKPKQMKQQETEVDHAPKKTNGKHVDLSLVDWHTIPVSEGNVLLSDLQRLWEHASKVMQQRQVAAESVKCHCKCGRTLHPSQACMSMALRNPDNLMPYNVYFATQECVRQYNRRTMGLAANVDALPR